MRPVSHFNNNPFKNVRWCRDIYQPDGCATYNGGQPTCSHARRCQARCHPHTDCSGPAEPFTHQLPNLLPVQLECFKHSLIDPPSIEGADENKHTHSRPSKNANEASSFHRGTSSLAGGQQHPQEAGYHSRGSTQLAT